MHLSMSGDGRIAKCSSCIRGSLSIVFAMPNRRSVRYDKATKLKLTWYGPGSIQNANQRPVCFTTILIDARQPCWVCVCVCAISVARTCKKYDCKLICIKILPFPRTLQDGLRSLTITLHDIKLLVAVMCEPSFQACVFPLVQICR